MGRLRRRQTRQPPNMERRRVAGVQTRPRARARALATSAEEMQLSRLRLRRRTKALAVAPAVSAANSTTSSIASSEGGDEATSAEFDLSQRQRQNFVPPALAAEIEDFFRAAETREQRRFADKYNYDVATDAPLAGRYEWLLPTP